MTKDSIQLFRDMYFKEVKHPIDPNRKGTRGEYIRIILDGGIEFNTQTDFVIFDDDNEMIHIICNNDDPLSQFDWPFKIMSAPYEIVFTIESIVSKANLIDILDDSFLGDIINDKKKEFIKKWAEGTNNHKAYPMDADPYYVENPKIISNGTKIIPRDDGKVMTNVTSKASKSVKAVKDAASFVDAISNAEPGATVVLSSNIEVSDSIKIDKPISIVGSGKTIISSNRLTFEVTADAEISNINVESTAKNGRCLDIEAAGVNVKLNNVHFNTLDNSHNQPITIRTEAIDSSLSMTNSSVQANNLGYGIIVFAKSNIELVNSSVNGYSCIYMKPNSEGSTVNLINSDIIGYSSYPGEDNRFATVIFEAGNIDVNVDADSIVSYSTVGDDIKYTIFNLASGTIDNVNIHVDGEMNGIPFYINGCDSILNNTFIVPKTYEKDFWHIGYGTESAELDCAIEHVKITDRASTVVNGVCYSTVEEAIEAAEGKPIYLTDDVVIENITFDKNTTLISDGGATINNKITIEKDANVKLEGLNIVNTDTSNTKRLIDSKSGNVTLKNCNISTGSELYNVAHFEACDNIEISGCTFSSATSTDIYNIMEFCLDYKKNNIKELKIENCKFGISRNNTISLHSFVDNAKVTITGNEFECSNNAIRVSNYTAAKNVKIYTNNNKYNDTVNNQYSGFIFFQKMNASGSDIFKDMNVYLINLYGPEGKQMKTNGTGREQVWYTYLTDDEPNVIFN